jgi:hypothetical protein
MRSPTPGAAWRPYAQTRVPEQATTGNTGYAGTLRRTSTTADNLRQWEYEVTSGGRVRYVIDDHNRAVWLVYASPRHPKDTDR